MIGYYNYTVVLTFMSLISALVGITLSIDGVHLGAIACLALSGFFDMLDGPVARTKSDRSHDERLFGIQLDSLCDLVAFGVFPVVICFNLGVKGPIGFVVLIYFAVCGVIRLGYFNVRETNNFFSEEVHEKIFIGLPITSIAVVLPLVYLLSTFMTDQAFILVLHFVLLIVGTLFIGNFQMHKPKLRTLIIFCVLVAIAIAAVAIIDFPHLVFEL